MSDRVETPIGRTRPWKDFLRVFFNGGAAYLIAYILTAYSTTAHLETYPTLQPREKVLHCAAEAIVFVIPVFGVVAWILMRAARRMEQSVQGLKIGVVYGVCCVVGGVIGLGIGFVFAGLSFAGLTMAKNLPLAVACGGAAGLTTMIGRDLHTKAVFRVFEWALILALCGIAFGLKGILWQ